jgi:hypothetical protein
MRLRNHAALPHFSRAHLGRRLLKPSLKSAQNSELTLQKSRAPDKLGPVLHSISGSLLLTLPDPTLKAGEVLVRVRASTVNQSIRSMASFAWATSRSLRSRRPSLARKLPA